MPLSACTSPVGHRFSLDAHGYMLAKSAYRHSRNASVVGSNQRLNLRDQCPELPVLVPRDAADDAVLAAAEIAVDAELVWIALREQIDEVFKHVRVYPVVLDSTRDPDALAATLESQPCLALLQINVILDLRQGERALRHERHALGDPYVAPVVLDALGVKMPKDVAV